MNNYCILQQPLVKRSKKDKILNSYKVQKIKSDIGKILYLGTVIIL